MTRLLTYPLAAIALPASLVALAAWRVACPVPPEERLYGTRPSVRSMLRTALGLDRVATDGAPA